MFRLSESAPGFYNQKMRFEIIDEQYRSTVFVIDKAEFTVGSSPENEVVVRNEFVSRQHARIYARNRSAYLEDLGSANGTFYKDARLTIGRRVPLFPSQPVRLGPSIKLVMLEDETSKTETTRTLTAHQLEQMRAKATRSEASRKAKEYRRDRLKHYLSITIPLGLLAGGLFLSEIKEQAPLKDVVHPAKDVPRYQSKSQSQTRLGKGPQTTMLIDSRPFLESARSIAGAHDETVVYRVLTALYLRTIDPTALDASKPVLVLKFCTPSHLKRLRIILLSKAYQRLKQNPVRGSLFINLYGVLKLR